MIDSHAHILEEYYDNIEKLLLECKDNGIKGIINCSDDYFSALEVISHTKKYEDFLYSSVGIHPLKVSDNVEKEIKKLEALISENNVVAIGEIGLDYYWNKENKELQKKFFESQIKLAIKYNKPVIIHSRDAIQDTYDILKKYPIKGVIHCFNGSLEMAEKFISIGFLLGIGGTLTFKNSKLYTIIEKIDLKNILLETDSPYLSPEPNRGKINNPSNVYYVAKRIAEIKAIDVEKVIEITSVNAVKLLSIVFENVSKF